ncbi:TonB-dependent siderophore receptor [Neisseria flavescens]|nr:TonB-dependent siderophore receptor [Neisseria flavescens]QCL69811.1 TonB-dependent siderophore receptor [Neisseria flavescens]SPY01655.1 TonB-dependent iron siderophore receptor protein [Neisseria meningitidis]SPY06810.1 TonB-dependent iron siderophore receptor protein [Neisseria meningitidis]STZ66399.1 TonB-dependent iron siderophore receptor protein [Neisseria flavescens]
MSLPVFPYGKLSFAVSLALCSAYSFATEVENTQPQERVDLPTVTVQGVGKQTTSNYTIPASSAATGIKLTQRETPQSLSVVTAKQIEDQGLDSLQDVLKQTPGVFHSKMGNNVSGHSQFISRSQAIDSISVDGAPKFLYEGKAIRRSTNNLDSTLYDQVVVVRGASGLSNGGMGEPGGTVALERKKPTAKPAVSVEAGVGSWKHYRFVLDANQPLNADNTLRGRTILVSDHGGDYLPNTSRHNHTFYGILSYDIAPQTQWNIGTEIHRFRNTGSSPFSYLTVAGNPRKNQPFKPFAASPRSNASAKWAYGKDTSAEIFTSINHEFENGWALNGNYSHTYGKSDAVSGIAGPFFIDSDYSAEFFAERNQAKYTDQDFSLSLDGDYPLLGRKHEFNAGISYQYNKETPSYYKENEDEIVPDLRLFDGNFTKPAMPYLGDGFAHMKNLSVYGSTRFKLTDRLALIGGGRFVDWRYRQYRYDYDDLNDFVYNKYKNKVFIPYLGASYDLNDNLTAYTSYTTIFRPQGRYLDQNGKPLEPQRGKTYELGLKASWFEGRLNASASAFMNKRDHLGVVAGKFANSKKKYYRAANNTTTKGVELSVGGRLSDKWLLNASYARSKIKNSEGVQLHPSYPVHLFKLFTAYDVTDRLNLGANVNWQSRSHTLDEYPADINPAAAAALTQRPYATLDLTAHYKIGKSTRISLDFENVFNKRYRTMPDIHVYGTPRSVTATVKHTF